METPETEFHREQKPGYRPNSYTENKQRVAEQSSNKASTAYFDRESILIQHIQHTPSLNMSQ